jgi:hypothetical protein
LQGHDAVRLLHRAIRAEGKKTTLLRLIRQLQVQLDDWQSSTGEKFVVGRVDYRAEVLAFIQADFATITENEEAVPDLVPSAALAAMDSARNSREQPANVVAERANTASSPLGRKDEFSISSLSMGSAFTDSDVEDTGSVSDDPA